ncbi:hypothetical protein GXM_02909 [Nostoc sphaeroides CCNUC1]|uniref:Uncharacterized protein n=1 Tax=Nostoc sphaeroides CCNUC1 TaxID=2653204 RepID=A0A5P8VYD4_9NOSO|nr:hypothetical protein GXM_02909 [Nostoc sphaeroides CCNUC1]
MTGDWGLNSSQYPIPDTQSPIPLNGGREFYTSFGGDWFS